MRWPTLEADGWALDSAEARHAASPEHFPIPPAEVRSRLPIGCVAKLIFEIVAPDEHGTPQQNGERMWVAITERHDDHYIGRLVNAPHTIRAGVAHYLAYGVEVPFSAAHVIDADGPNREAFEALMAQPPPRRWPR